MKSDNLGYTGLYLMKVLDLQFLLMTLLITASYSYIIFYVYLPPSLKKKKIVLAVSEMIFMSLR